jgi:SAM-dependent methyltransferase
LDRVVDKEVLDFGCGTGYQSVALARAGAKHVVGLDVNPSYLEKARQLANQTGLDGKVTFLDRLNRSFRARFDVVISQNTMEHFPQPIDVLREMKLVLKDGGVIFITFGPPWFAPYGSHMNFFVRLPWVNILFDEKTIMTVRSYFRKDGAKRYEDVEGGLNKMTVRKFEKLTSIPGLRVEYQRYDCVKGLNFLGKLPLIREVFVNQISCVLTPVASHSSPK